MRFAVAAAGLFLTICGQAAFAQKLPQLHIERVVSNGQFEPDPNKAYLLVESSNTRPLITFVKAADSSPAPDPGAVAGYIEIPRDNRFAENRGISVWLFEVPPGEYFFSSITWQFLPADVDCACMGSVRFPVTRGKVTTIRVETAILDHEGQQIGIGNGGQGLPKGRKENDLFAMRGLVVGQPTSDLWQGKLDQKFIEPALFSPVPELPNWFGNQINRVMPIAGILSYHRDQMLDLRNTAR